MTGLQIYAIIWLILQLILTGVLLGQSKSGKEFLVKILTLIITVAFSLPIFIAGFKYIFKI